MRILFVHQNGPAQFRHLAPALAQDRSNDVVFITETGRQSLPVVRMLRYPPPPESASNAHHYLRRAETCVRRGQIVARACLQLGRRGFTPDLVIAHPGWGESLFLRDVLPRAKILSYCELFYRTEGQDTGYVPETALGLDGRCRIRTWNSDLLTSLSIMDRGISPTRWQRDQHPAEFHSKIDVVHDGIDTDEVAPDPDASFQVPGGARFRVGDEVVTYVARDLEPVRGFVLLMRALPELLRRRPGAQIVICGGDGVSYGRPPPAGGSWREAMLQEISFDRSRVHFVGKLPRASYLDLLRVSALHVYPTVPFVLSWSCIEALAAGCLLLGADVEPVREVVEDGRNGFLVDARDTAAFASRAADLLANRHQLGPIRTAARAGARARFDLRTCLAAQRRLVAELIS